MQQNDSLVDGECQVVNTHVAELCCSLRLVGDDTDTGFSLAEETVSLPGQRPNDMAGYSARRTIQASHGLTAAPPAENPDCSCKLTRVRSRRRTIQLRFNAQKTGPQEQVLELRCADGTALTIPLRAEVDLEKWCDFADIPSPSLLIHLLKVRGVQHFSSRSGEVVRRCLFVALPLPFHRRSSTCHRLSAAFRHVDCGSDEVNFGDVHADGQYRFPVNVRNESRAVTPVQIGVSEHNRAVSSVSEPPSRPFRVCAGPGPCSDLSVSVSAVKSNDGQHEILDGRAELLPGDNTFWVQKKIRDLP